MSTTLSSKNWGNSYILRWAGPFAILARGVLGSHGRGFVFGAAQEQVAAAIIGESEAVAAEVTHNWALESLNGWLIGGVFAGFLT